MNQAKRISKPSGFTLIEIMIVLAILGGILAVGMPRLVRPNEQNLNSAVRHLMVLSKDIRNKARINRVTYRIAFQMDDKEGHGYWVERASGEQLISIDEDDTRGSRPDDEENPSPFQQDPSVMKEPRPLPDGFYFEDIENASGLHETSGNMGYIHFFPEGLVDESVVHLTNRRNLNWTLAIHPLTGRMDIIKENVSLDQLRK